MQISSRYKQHGSATGINSQTDCKYSFSSPMPGSAGARGRRIVPTVAVPYRLILAAVFLLLPLCATSSVETQHDLAHVPLHTHALHPLDQLPNQSDHGATFGHDGKSAGADGRPSATSDPSPIEEDIILEIEKRIQNEPPNHPKEAIGQPVQPEDDFEIDLTSGAIEEIPSTDTNDQDTPLATTDKKDDDQLVATLHELGKLKSSDPLIKRAKSPSNVAVERRQTVNQDNANNDDDNENKVNNNINSNNIDINNDNDNDDDADNGGGTNGISTTETKLPPFPAPVYEALRQEKRAADEQQSSSLLYGPGNVGDTLFIVISTVCSAIVVFGMIGAGVCWYRLHRRYKSAEEKDYYNSSPLASGGPGKPGWSGTPNGKHNLGTAIPGDSNLDRSAMLYNYQNTKQQIIAMEQSNTDAKCHESEDSDAEADDTGDYSVYECPGLAPTGDLEVNNPLFESSPSSPQPVRQIQQQPQAKR